MTTRLVRAGLLAEMRRQLANVKRLRRWVGSVEHALPGKRRTPTPGIGAPDLMIRERPALRGINPKTCNAPPGPSRLGLLRHRDIYAGRTTG